MLLYPSINDLRKTVDSKYTLVVLTAKRARDLIDGKPYLDEDTFNDVPVSVAAEEASEGLIKYMRPETHTV